MSLNDLKLEIGKSYNIDYVIQELQKASDVQLGHIVVDMTREHKYHVNKAQLEDLSKKIKATIAEGGKEYEKIGKKFVPLTDITILSIVDPYIKYEKYNKFYISFEPQIVTGIDESKRYSVAAPTDAIINEAKKMGIVIEKDTEFLDGMGIFFKRRGISTGPISGGKYILFEKVGPNLPKRVKVPEMKAADREAIQRENTEREVLERENTEREVLERETAEKEYEGYREYTGFYDEFFKQIVQGMADRNKEEIAAPISSIIEEGQKMGYTSVEKEKDFLRGMELYFKIRGISSEKMEMDENNLVFRQTG